MTGKHPAVLSALLLPYIHALHPSNTSHRRLDAFKVFSMSDMRPSHAEKPTHRRLTEARLRQVGNVGLSVLFSLTMTLIPRSVFRVPLAILSYNTIPMPMLIPTFPRDSIIQNSLRDNTALPLKRPKAKIAMRPSV